jgi:predicted ribosome quality control (RQC) complex YloA/Tae2 family protein
MAVCRSSSWAAKLAGATQAYWVYPNQVSKVAEAGEYLSLGSLMVRGIKPHIPNLIPKP